MGRTRGNARRGQSFRDLQVAEAPRDTLRDRLRTTLSKERPDTSSGTYTAAILRYINLLR